MKRTPGGAVMRRTERRGIVVEDDDFDRGYWDRYDNEPFKRWRSSQWRLGWIACDLELKEERRFRARLAAKARWARSSRLSAALAEPYA